MINETNTICKIQSNDRMGIKSREYKVSTNQLNEYYTFRQECVVTGKI